MNIKPIFTNFIYNKKPALPNVHAAGSIKAENRINNKNVNSAASNYFKKFTDKIKRLITYFKSMIVKIDKTEVKRISKLPVDQFLLETQKIIANSKGYSSEFMAPIVLQEFDTKKIGMLYNATSNIVYVNTANKLKPSAELFSMLCHEYEHFHQNLQILRTAGLSDKAINNYSKIAAENSICNFQSMYNNVKLQDLPALKEQLGSHYEFVSSYLKAKENGPESLKQWVLQATANDEKLIKQKWCEVRDSVIKKCGQIEENSKEAKVAQEYYNGFMLDGSLTGIKKFSTLNEVEAYLSTIINFYNFIFKKFF